MLHNHILASFNGVKETQGAGMARDVAGGGRGQRRDSAARTQTAWRSFKLVQRWVHAAAADGAPGQ